MPCILVVEDEPSLLDSLRRGLVEEGYEVRAAKSITDANWHLAEETIEAILLDLMLPDGDGVQFVLDLRMRALTTPVLIATARDSIEDRIAGLDAGADDYIVKPFSFDELLARLRALLRRSSFSVEPKIVVDDLELDLITRRTTRAGCELELTQRQFELLSYLMQTAGQIVTREMIARDVWKETTATWTNVIEVQVNHLRRRIERPEWPAILHTVRGQGYVLGVRG